MNAGQKGARQLASRQRPSRDTVCNSCLNRISHQWRRHAATATAQAEQPTITHQEPSIPPVTQTGPRRAYRLMASPVLSRPPMLTRELTPFEKAFHLYQKRLNERLALPFTRYFYYKKGTPGDVEWKRKAKLRKSAARDIGIYSGYGSQAWNDEVLVGDATAEPANQVEALINDAEGRDIVEEKLVGDVETGGEEISGDAAAGEGTRKPVGQQITIEKPLPRWTEADERNDTRSLNRALDRSLYLLVQNKDGRWRFPEDRVYGRESLHQAAERTIVQAFGLNMNTWLIGNQPVAHYAFDFPKPVVSKIASNRLAATSAEEVEQEELGERTFFMKCRLMAGKPDMQKNEYGDQDFQWLTKEEIEPKVTTQYWASVRNMLADR